MQRAVQLYDGRAPGLGPGRAARRRGRRAPRSAAAQPTAARPPSCWCARPPPSPGWRAAPPLPALRTTPRPVEAKSAAPTPKHMMAFTPASLERGSQRICCRWPQIELGLHITPAMLLRALLFFEAKGWSARTGQAPLLGHALRAWAAQARVGLLRQVHHARAGHPVVAHQLLRIPARAHARLPDGLHPWTRVTTQRSRAASTSATRSSTLTSTVLGLLSPSIAWRPHRAAQHCLQRGRDAAGTDVEQVDPGRARPRLHRQLDQRRRPRRFPRPAQQ